MRLRLLTTLSALALSGTLAAGCSGEGEGHGEGEGEGNARAALSAGEDSDGATRQSSGGESEGGESEGGESEGGESANGESANGESEGARAVTGKPAYIAGLLMIEGHLRAATALYIAGDAAMAGSHMKHPGDEIYTALKPAFAAYDHPGLAGEIEALASAAASGESEAVVADALNRLVTGVGAAIDASDPSTKDLLLAATRTLSTAGDEYGLAVKDGRVVNAHEYQDAFGFMAALSARLAGATGKTAAERQALDVARTQVGIALAVAPGVQIPESAADAAETYYGAAARVEIAALGL